MSDENSIKIFSESRNSCLTIGARSEEIIAEGINYSSMCLSVEVNDEGFRGFNGEAGVETDVFEQFAADLAACERSRRGRAHLSCMSHGDLELTIESFDGWGHFALKYTISKVFFIAGTARIKSVSGEFELDSSLFSQIVADLASLLPKF